MRALLHFAMLLLRCVPACLRSRNEQAIVELALRQQLAIYAEKGPRPRITRADRGFWILLSRFWPGRKWMLIFVQPLDILIETNQAAVRKTTAQILEIRGLP